MAMPHIAISHIEALPPGVFENFVNFVNGVSTEKLNIVVESRENPGPFAGVEWLLPTAIIIFIAKSYFEGFLKEAGVDHYNILKANLNSLIGRLGGIHMGIVSTPGKVRESRKYSMAQSVVCEIDVHFRLKFLIQEDLSAEEIDHAVSEFLDFLKNVHSGNLDSGVIEELQSVPIVGGTLLVAYNPETRKIAPVDPMSRR